MTSSEGLLPPAELLEVQQAVTILRQYEFDDQTQALEDIARAAYRQKHPLDYSTDLGAAIDLVRRPYGAERQYPAAGILMHFKAGYQQLLEHHNAALTEVANASSDFLQTYPGSVVFRQGDSLAAVTSVEVQETGARHRYMRLMAMAADSPVRLLAGELFCDVSALDADIRFAIHLSQND